ncbi:MAG: protein kinase [Gemmatimonadaceae bacterium]|nr:protein kinase [Gemmatimonadaceae bacterium]
MTDLERRQRLSSALAPDYILDAPASEAEGSPMTATEAASGRRVVISVVPVPDGATFSLERFRRELSAAQGISHANVISVLSAQDADGLPVYLSPFVEGETLRERMARGRVPVDDAVGILRDIAKGLAAVHARGVVHRALGPDHVFLTATGARVLDAGVARALAAATGADRVRGGVRAPGLSRGAPAYLAPEQIAGDPLMDHRVDIYAWGVLAWELLAGDHPFAGRGDDEMLAAHREAPVPSLTGRSPISRGLGALVERAMAKAAAQRPTSATELVSVIEHQRHEPAARAERRGPTITIPWRGLIGAGAVLGALVLGFRFLLRDAGRATDGRVVAVAPFRATGAAADVEYLEHGLMELLAPAIATFDGARAADVRGFLGALRRDAPSGVPDAEAVVRAATRLGATQVIDGTIAGDAARVVVRGVLYATRDGAELETVTVEGPADSVSTLVARVANGLLAGDASDAAPEVLRVLGRDATALRRYIEGRAAYRGGNLAAALDAFTDALAIDSTLAIAAVGAADAAAWMEDGAAGTFDAIAWRHRGRLAADDSARLIARLGRAFPEPVSARDVLAGAEAFVEQRPEDAEAHVRLARLLVQAAPPGDAKPDAADFVTRALSHAERAWALDSTFVPALALQPTLLVRAGRPADALKAVRTLAALDSQSLALPYLRMFVGARAGDSTEFARGFAAAQRLPTMARARTGARWLLADGGRIESAERLLVSAYRAPDADRNVIGPMLGLLAFTTAQTWRLWDLVPLLPPGPTRDVTVLVSSSVVGVDVQPPAPVAAALESALKVHLATPRSATYGWMPPQAADAAWALVQWYAVRGDTAALERLGERLQSLSRDGDRRVALEANAAAAGARAELAMLRRQDDRAARLAAADSATRIVPYAGSVAADIAALRLAAGYETLGRLPDARRVLSRVVPGGGGLLRAYAWQAAARAAEDEGDRLAARDAWRRFAQLQAIAALRERAGLDTARAAIARLTPGGT